MGGIVIDKKTLMINAVKLISLLTTLVTYLLHLHSGHDECALTKAQTNTITGAMAGGNSTCTYSMTLASILN